MPCLSALILRSLRTTSAEVSSSLFTGYRSKLRSFPDENFSVSLSIGQRNARSRPCHYLLKPGVCLRSLQRSPPDRMPRLRLLLTKKHCSHLTADTKTGDRHVGDADLPLTAGRNGCHTGNTSLKYSTHRYGHRISPFSAESIETLGFQVLPLRERRLTTQQVDISTEPEVRTP